MTERKTPPDSSPDQEIIKAFEAGGVVEYLEYLQDSKRLMWLNFKAGVAKGLGITVGASLILGLLIWMLAKLVALPFVGEYFEQAEDYVSEIAEKTDYSDDFAEMHRLLRQLEENTRP